MKITILLLVLLSIVFSQKQPTILNIPKDFSSSFTFHYKGNIYAVLDVIESNTTLSPQLGMISNNKWSKTLDLPLRCDQLPCSTNTHDIWVQKNTLYVDIGVWWNVQRTIAAINLDTLAVSTSVKTPDNVNIDGAQFVPISDTMLIYMHFQRMFIQYWDAAKLTLPSINWQNWDVSFRSQIQSILPYDSNNIVTCNYGFCQMTNINSNQATDLDGGIYCTFSNFIRSSKTLFCSNFDYDANATIVTGYYVSTTSISQNLTLTLGGQGEYPSFSSVNDKLNVAYVITSFYNVDQTYSYYLYTVDLNLYQQISRVPLNIGNYFIDRISQAVNSEGDGILALPLRASDWTANLPAQMLLIPV